MKKPYFLLLMAFFLHNSLQSTAFAAATSATTSTRGVFIGETSPTLAPPSLNTTVPPHTSAQGATSLPAPSLVPPPGVQTSPTLSPLPTAGVGTQGTTQGTAQKPAQGLDIYNSVAPSVPPAPADTAPANPASVGSAPTATTLGPVTPATTPTFVPPPTVPTTSGAPANSGTSASSLQERELPASPLPPKPAVTPPVMPPKAPTAAEIEEARRADALRKEQEAQRQRELAAAQERLRQEQSFLAAAKAHARGDYKTAIDLWSALAKEGHAAAMTAMGLIYDKGQGVLLNSKEAVMWFRLAADGGDKDGMYHLGRMLAQGRGGRQHFATAATWLQKAADLGQHDAQYLLAALYERGQGVVQNESTAAAWYSLAAAGHNVEAQARLGHLYHMGKGVPQNKERATLLLYGATMAGHKGAQEELYLMSQDTFKDKGFPKVTLFGADFAAEKGLTRAQMRSALSVSKVKALREDTSFICDVYDLTGTVPGAHQMAVCYGASPSNGAQGQQEMGFLKIDYKAQGPEHAKAIQNMVEARFGKASAGEQGQGYLWNLGRVIVATQYIPQKQEVGLMYMIPRVYHTTQGK